MSKRLLSLALCLAFAFPYPVFAHDGSLPSGFELPSGSGSEYVSGNYPGAVLMEVNLWGAVGKPGIHHIPARTDLVKLLSLAGGPMGDARTDEITIKRRTKDGDEILKYDVEKILDKGSERSPTLESNDIVIVPREKPAISGNTLAMVSFVGSVISVVLAAIVLGNQVKK